MDRRPAALYVEDETSLHALVGFWLEDAGFDVAFAEDGKAALDIIREAPPDVVITDAMMPELTGDELVAIMKDDPALAHIPIIMATAAASPLRVSRMMERGCVAVLGKPLDEASFIEATTAALRSA